MVRILVIALLAGCLGACAPAPSPSAAPTVDPAAQGVVQAERLTTIAGPWTVGEVKLGTYGDLWQGSTNDLSGQGTAARKAMQNRVVWRIDLAGPHGSEQLYLDAATGALADAITQGS